jgi:DNA-binding transcriptional regulator YhcF (GntR family)
VTNKDGSGLKPVKYAQIVNALRRRIADGTYPPGSQLPSETQLIAEFGVSRPTVVRALEQLKLAGEIDREHGRGSFVKAAPALPENLAALIGSTDSTQHGADLASILGRLNEVSEQLQRITTDVSVHGVATGRDAIRMIGEYGLAWSQLANGVRRAAVQGGLVDPRQLLDVMQELHDRYGLQTRPPKDHPEDPTKETTHGDHG